MFRIDNTDNVIDINEDNLAWEYDQANIFCPTYPQGMREADMERYVIYSVTRTEYENCRIFNPDPKVVAVCNTPHKVSFVTITFRSFTPTPGGLEFKPGEDYFFISTSSRTDLYRRANGRCSTNNMKAMFKVASVGDYNNEEEDADRNRVHHSSKNRVSTSVNVPRRIDANLYDLDESNSLMTGDAADDDDVIDEDVQRKRHSDYVQQQASVMKHEHSNAASATTSRQTTAFIVITLSILFHLYVWLNLVNCEYVQNQVKFIQKILFHRRRKSPVR